MLNALFYFWAALNALKISCVSRSNFSLEYSRIIVVVINEVELPLYSLQAFELLVGGSPV